MYSLNVPVPGEVRRIAADLAPSLAGFEAVRDRHTLVAKRLGAADEGYGHLASRVRRALAGAPAFEARVSEIGAFDDPPVGSAPVVYLAVESPGLHELHRRLVDALGAVEGLEGDDYVPHVTLARGGDHDKAERLVGRSVDPVTWTVGELVLWDARHREPAGRVSLPA